MGKINETIRVEKMKKYIYMHNFSKNYRRRLIGMSRVGVIREQQKKSQSIQTVRYDYYITLFI